MPVKKKICIFLKKGVDKNDEMIYTVTPASHGAQQKAVKKKLEKSFKKYLTKANDCDILDKLSTREGSSDP